MISTFLASIIMLSSIQVYRLELDTDTDTPYIVGQDNLRRQCCIVAPDEYAMMTGRVDQVWKALNSTKDGRRSLHGRETNTTITNDTIITTFGDGYIYREPFRERAVIHGSSMKSRLTVNGASSTMPNVRPRHLSDRQWEMVKKISERKSKSPKTVTVEHNAATGKDTVK